MTPHIDDQDFTLYVGDVREVLAGLPAESVHCCVTSPPYWGLRDYGAEGQLGLEPTPEEYVANMVAVFREVRRVLRRDGTCWLNLGDSYANDTKWGGTTGGKHVSELHGAAGGLGRGKRDTGLKAKDLVGIPWRLAFALQADGWCLRSDVIWSKPNPMPESVTDRPTKAHEYLFLLTPCQWSGGIEPWPMTREEAIWLAALVDGEGTICFQESPRKEWAPHISPRLSIVNTNRDLLERVAEITNIAEGTTPSPRRRNDGAPGRPIFTWQLTNEKATRIIAAIRPHLIAKRTQAELAVYVQALNDKHKGRGCHRTTDADLELKRKASAACSALNHGEDVDLGWFKPVRAGRWLTPKNTFYDADAIREPAEWARWGDQTNGKHEGSESAAGWIGSRSKAELTPRNDGDRWNEANGRGFVPNQSGRNKRSVWQIATESFAEAHFATFPQALVEPCILAGTSERGCCPVCGAPKVEQVVRTPLGSGPSVDPTPLTGRKGMNRERRPDEGTREITKAEPRAYATQLRDSPHREAMEHEAGSAFAHYIRTDDSGARPLPPALLASWLERGWLTAAEASDCGCNAGTVPCTVLDPFMGSGTTALVARRHGRRSIGIELNAEYAKLAAARLQQLSLLAEPA